MKHDRQLYLEFGGEEVAPSERDEIEDHSFLDEFWEVGRPPAGGLGPSGTEETLPAL
jgi:hypothetical protein